MTLKKILLTLFITILTLSGTAFAAISYTLSTIPNPPSIYTGDSTTVSVSISNNNLMYKGICANSLDSSSWSTEYPVSSGHTITKSISVQAPALGSGAGSVQHTVNSYCYSTLDSTKVYQSTSFILTYTENPRYIASQAINSAQSAPLGTIQRKQRLWLIFLVLGLLSITAILYLRKRKKSKLEVISQSKELECVQPLPLQSSEQTKKSPTKKPEENGTIDVKSAYEYKGAKIYYKIKVVNNTSETIGDIKVHLFVPEVFLLSEKEKSLSMLEPKESKTVTFEIRPTGECGDCNVSGKVEYYDYSTKGRQMLDIETKSLSIICPVLKRKEIDLKQWEQITDALIKAEENINELSVPAENLFNITSRVIKDSGMFLLKPEITSTPQLFNGIAMFYAEGVTGLRYAAYIEVVGGARKSRMILKVWAEKEEALTGFYHRILDEIEKRIDVKIFIDDTILQQHIHIGDKIGTQVKDSFVQRSSIGAGARKCPNCGREVDANEKFCNECGAKL